MEPCLTTRNTTHGEYVYHQQQKSASDGDELCEKEHDARLAVLNTTAAFEDAVNNIPPKSPCGTEYYRIGLTRNDKHAIDTFWVTGGSFKKVNASQMLKALKVKNEGSKKGEDNSDDSDSDGDSREFGSIKRRDNNIYLVDGDVPLPFLCYKPHDLPAASQTDGTTARTRTTAQKTDSATDDFSTNAHNTVTATSSTEMSTKGASKPPANAALGLSTGTAMLAGIVVGGIAFAVILVGLVVYLVRKRRHGKRRGAERGPESGQTVENIIYAGAGEDFAH